MFPKKVLVWSFLLIFLSGCSLSRESRYSAQCDEVVMANYGKCKRINIEVVANTYFELGRGSHD